MHSNTSANIQNELVLVSSAMGTNHGANGGGGISALNNNYLAHHLYASNGNTTDNF